MLKCFSCKTLRKQKKTTHSNDAHDKKKSHRNVSASTTCEKAIKHSNDVDTRSLEKTE